MMKHRIDLFIIGMLVISCGQQELATGELSSDKAYTESYAAPVTRTVEESSYGLEDDSLSVKEPAVVFYVPQAEDLNVLMLDNVTLEGLVQAIGDYAYYAGIVADSLKSKQIPVYYTDKQLIKLGTDHQQLSFERSNTDSPMGMILYDGVEHYKVFPGMQTHISLLAAVAGFFNDEPDNSIPLSDYFETTTSEHLHIYSSHSDILNQVGRRIHPSYYSKFGETLARKAGKYNMSVFGYCKIDLTDSVKAFICRVPSIYDESSVKLFIWDNINQQVIDEIQLAENVWNERWILVKDSWINLQAEKGIFSLVTRKKEARMDEGERMESDSLFQWQWNGSTFEPLPVAGLSVSDYPLQDWESYQEPKKPTEITIIDEDYVWLPLETGDLTWENVIMALPKPYSMNKEPIENQLAARQIDTLITISRSNLKLTFYQAPKNILLVKGEVRDESLILKRGIKVGISKADFSKVFDKLSSYESIPDQIILRSKTADRIISCTFQGDTLTRIELTNFIH